MVETCTSSTSQQPRILSHDEVIPTMMESMTILWQYLALGRAAAVEKKMGLMRVTQMHERLPKSVGFGLVSAAKMTSKVRMCDNLETRL